MKITVRNISAYCEVKISHDSTTIELGMLDEGEKKELIEELLNAANYLGCDIMDNYDELIMAVENKYEGETRHQTALRYIRISEISMKGKKAESSRDL